MQISLNGLLAEIWFGEEDCAPSTELMMPTQGFASGLFGRRTRSLGRGGRRGVTLTFFGAPFSGIAVVVPKEHSSSTAGDTQLANNTHYASSELLDQCEDVRVIGLNNISWRCWR